MLLPLVNGRLIDYRPWAWPTEGPYSRLSKLCQLNVLSAREASRALFGRPLVSTRAKPFHGRSLLAGASLQSRPHATVVTRSIAAASLEPLCGQWTRWIASDERLRFCPACLCHGYQSVVCQIDGLVDCPLHALRLLDACPHCGTATPPYAVTYETFIRPFCCAACDRPFSDFWQLSHLYRCKDKPFDERPFSTVLDWLKRIGSLHIEWPEVSSWHPSHDPQPESTVIRKAVFDTLKCLVPLDGIPAKPAAIRIVARGPSEDRFRKYLPAYDQNQQRILLAIYKSIRRHVRRLVRRMSPELRKENPNPSLIGWDNMAPLPQSRGKLTSSHAWFLWRSRFELEFSIAGSTPTDFPLGCPNELTLRPEVLSWPVSWAARPSEWGQFAWHCFLADLDAARGWSRTLVSLPALQNGCPTLAEQRAAWSQYSAAYGTWAPRLDPAIRRWPSTLTQLAWTPEGQGGKQLVLVGLANTTHEGTTHGNHSDAQ